MVVVFFSRALGKFRYVGVAIRKKLLRTIKVALCEWIETTRAVMAAVERWSVWQSNWRPMRVEEHGAQRAALRCAARTSPARTQQRASRARAFRELNEHHSQAFS